MESFYLVKFNHNENKWSIDSDTMLNKMDYPCFSSDLVDDDRTQYGWFNPALHGQDNDMNQVALKDTEGYLIINAVLAKLNNVELDQVEDSLVITPDSETSEEEVAGE